jgi:hypothetical protein
MTSETTATSSREVLPHPPNSLNFISSDNHLFRALKDHVKGQHYEDNIIQEAMHGLLGGNGKEILPQWDGILRPCSTGGNCLDYSGDFCQKSDWTCPGTTNIFFMCICFDVQCVCSFLE